MAKNYDKTDLVWTSRGDYVISHDGDIMDTERDPLRSLVQEIKTRAGGDLGDWSAFPDLGASLSDFVGEPNTKITAESIKIRLIAALAKYGFIDIKDLKIQYLPFDREKILLRISINVAPTVENANSEILTLHSIYSYEENQVSFII